MAILKGHKMAPGKQPDVTSRTHPTFLTAYVSWLNVNMLTQHALASFPAFRAWKQEPGDEAKHAFATCI